MNQSAAVAQTEKVLADHDKTVSENKESIKVYENNYYNNEPVSKNARMVIYSYLDIKTILNVTQFLCKRDK